MKKKSSPRLKSFSYNGPFAYSLTLCTYERKSHLNSAEMVSDILGRLKESADKYGFHVVVYTFMPDHLHLLVRGEDGSDLKGFVRYFKQMSGYDFKTLHGEPLWQLSYYDHVIRKEKEIMAVARYILENPVRKGLADDYRNYPFSGSFLFDIKDVL